MIDRFTIQRVKDAANIVDVMTELGFDLKKKAAEYQCLCPFHADRHIGSFTVSPRKNIYHCFSCNAHGGPIDFLMEQQKMTFTEAIQWLGRMYGIEVEGSEHYKYLTPRKPHTPPPPLPMLTIPYGYVKHTLQHLDNDILLTWIRSLPWDGAQQPNVERVIHNYLVGTAQDGTGFTIFWQVDDHGQVRTGKMMRYNTDGHRRKDIKYNSDWIHARLKKAGQYDDEKAEYRTCYFGQHLTDFYPNATICVVESEKTALIMAIAYGQPDRYLWLGCGGKNYINREHLAPFIERKRHIILFPDRDAINEWRERARQIDYDRLSINADIVTRDWIERDGPKADIADIVVRSISDNNPRMSPPSRPQQNVSDVMEHLKQKSEAFALLVDTFDLAEKP